jgi:multiple sugar transport system permease protein
MNQTSAFTLTTRDMKAQKTFTNGLIYLGLTVLALVMLIPFAWMLSTSLKPAQYILRATPQFIPHPATTSSYTNLIDLMPVDKMLFNSTLVAVLGTAGQVIVSAMAAYAFSRLEWRGRNLVFVLYLLTMMVPRQVTLIPQFILIRQLGWVNTYQGLILPGLFSAFGVFLLRQSFLGMPHELEEAAFIDGANHLTVFWRIVLPISKPALATLSVLSFMEYWNSYLWPLFVARKDEFMTLPVGLAKLQGGPRALTQWNMVMAGAVITVLPILIVYLLAQKWFIRSVALSGIKG